MQLALILALLLHGDVSARSTLDGPKAAPSALRKTTDSGFDPPAIMEPKSGFAIYVPPETVKSVHYIALDGEEPFPVSLVGGSPTAFVFLSRGLPAKNYRFVGVASDKDGNQTRKDFAVQVGKPPVVAPPPVPKPPETKPPEATKVYYFLVVRADGPATNHFVKLMSDPAWDTIKKAGHKVKDMGVTAAAALGVDLPSGASVPAVVTLVESADKSTIVRPAVPLPTTGAGILDLPKAVK